MSPKRTWESPWLLLGARGPGAEVSTGAAAAVRGASAGAASTARTKVVRRVARRRRMALSLRDMAEVNHNDTAPVRRIGPPGLRSSPNWAQRTCDQASAISGCFG